MKTKLKYNKLKISTDMLLLLLFLLILEDYLLTYIGIHHLNIVEEVNPLMIQFMTLPFNIGFGIRCIVTFVSTASLKLAQFKLNPTTYRKIVLIPLWLQLIPYTAHTIWLCKYLTTF